MQSFLCARARHQHKQHWGRVGSRTHSHPHSHALVPPAMTFAAAPNQAGPIGEILLWLLPTD